MYVTMMSPFYPQGALIPVSWERRSEQQGNLLFALLEAARLASGEDENDVVSKHSEETAAEEEPEKSVEDIPASTPRAAPEPKKAKKGKKSKGHRCPTKLISGGPCVCCGVRLSPQWRRPLEDDSMLCNACGIYYTRHKTLPERKSLASSGAAEEDVADMEDDAPAHSSQSEGVVLDHTCPDTHGPSDKDTSGDNLLTTLSSHNASVNTALEATHSALLCSTTSIPAAACDAPIALTAIRTHGPDTSYDSPSPSHSSSFTPAGHKRPAPAQQENNGPSSKLRRMALGGEQSTAKLSAATNPPAQDTTCAATTGSCRGVAAMSNRQVPDAADDSAGCAENENTQAAITAGLHSHFSETAALAIDNAANVAPSTATSTRTCTTGPAPTSNNMGGHVVSPSPPTSHVQSAGTLMHMMRPHAVMAVHHHHHPLMGPIQGMMLSRHMQAYAPQPGQGMAGMNPHQLAMLWSAMANQATHAGPQGSHCPQPAHQGHTMQAPTMGFYITRPNI